MPKCDRLCRAQNPTRSAIRADCCCLSRRRAQSIGTSGSHGKESARISLGSYPAVGLRQARLLRDAARVQLAQGIDPRADRTTLRQADNDDGTFAALAERWFAFKSPRWTDAPKGTARQVRLYLDKDILPLLGHLRLAEIGRPDVLAVIRRIETRETLNIAAKVRAWLKRMFRFAVAEGKMEFNPAYDLEVVSVPKPPARHNPSLRRDELPDFLRTLRGAKVYDYTRYAIELLLLTGVRTGELRQATSLFQSWYEPEEVIWITIKMMINHTPPRLIPCKRPKKVQSPCPCNLRTGLRGLTRVQTRVDEGLMSG